MARTLLAAALVAARFAAAQPLAGDEWTSWTKLPAGQEFGIQGFQGHRGSGSMPWYSAAYRCSETDALARAPALGTSDGVQFRCQDGWCLQAKGRCNGYPECFDASDEAKCEASHKSAPSFGPRGISFQDTDPKRGSIAGPVFITSATSESDISYYEVYAEFSDGTLKALGKAAATGAMTYRLDVALPPGTFIVIAVSGNDKGQTMPSSPNGSARCKPADWVGHVTGTAAVLAATAAQFVSTVPLLATTTSTPPVGAADSRLLEDNFEQADSTRTPYLSKALALRMPPTSVVLWSLAVFVGIGLFAFSSRVWRCPSRLHGNHFMDGADHTDEGLLLADLSPLPA